MIGKRSFVVAGLLSAALLVVAATAMAAGHARRGPIQGKYRTGRDAVTSGNWSGYAAYGTTFKDVTGSWVVPTATCSSTKKHPQTTIAAFWVGLDGYGSNTVEQTGTDSDCVGGQAQYYAWYEFYPAGPVFAAAAETPQPGDHMTAEVSVSDGNVTTTLKDWGSTPGASPLWTYTSPSQSATGLDFSSAEWIAEKPSHLLTDFGSVDFSAATATSTAGTTGPIDNWTYDTITLANHPGPHGTALATPESISDSSGASSFTISQPS